MLDQGKWKDGAPKASEQFHNRVEESLRMIEGKQTEMEHKHAQKNKKYGFGRKLATVGTGVAAAAAVFVGVCYQNPVWAAELPLIGHIFERMEDKLSYGEDYEKYVKPVENPQETANEITKEESTAEGYSQTVNGTTVTLSESYCSGDAWYLSLMIQSEEPFADTLVDQQGMPWVNLKTEEKYSFASETYDGLIMLEGDFVDEHTYAGVVRLDMIERNGYTAQGTEGSRGVTEDFHADFTISQIIGTLAEPDKLDTGYSGEELAAMSDEEWEKVMNEAYAKGDWNQYPNKHENWWIDGKWEFSMDVAMKEKTTQVVDVNVLDENGAGILSVEKTPFEINLNAVYEEDFDYYPVILDAQGKVMESTGGNVGTVPVKGYDTSTVYVYLCDYMEYMDELKGNKITDPDGFKELMDERADLKAEVHFQ